MHVHAQDRPRLPSIFRRRAAVLATLAGLAAGGCGVDSGSSSRTADAEATAAPADAGPDGPSAAPPVGRGYDSAQFSVPLNVAIDPPLDRDPTIDSPNLLSFDAEEGDELKVRFLVPTVTYAPGTTSPVPVPTDFVTYLHQQASNGLVLTEETKTETDGRSTTVLTATSEPGGSYDGSLGCQSPDTAPADCFGVQPEYVLRLAVVSQDPGEPPLLVWARHYAGHDVPEFFEAFEAMLQSVRFR